MVLLCVFSVPEPPNFIFFALFPAWLSKKDRENGATMEREHIQKNGKNGAKMIKNGARAHPEK